MAEETISVVEAARLLGKGKDAVYAAVHAGEIPHIKCGAHIRICKGALMQKLHGPQQTTISLEQQELVALRVRRMELSAGLAAVDARIAEILDGERSADRYSARNAAG